MEKWTNIKYKTMLGIFIVRVGVTVDKMEKY